MIDARGMMTACRKLADDLRREHARGLGLVMMAGLGNYYANLITRADAAEAMDAQADRWAVELETGVPNRIDRDKIGG